MNRMLKNSAYGIAYLYSGIVVVIPVVTGLLVLASVVTVFAGIAGLIK